ncbi:helix-turn-helix domain-containing protein [Schaalia sp. lx-100]|uniref:helix-turn-helix domain-containing protein n=1 Tax=Schaalia sp. lx-100 TaxID=2899081 RepID=UPI001E5ED890|nr:helix-turn-helix transcriptional regulator [Schaalia sp. lx-100]MCD4557199.1 helix-turn-helix domain-containing protein [Schaalia sp. lx-100]
MISTETELRAEIARQNMTITHLAERTGMRREYLSARLNGHKDFTANELYSIGKVLCTPAWEIMRRAEQQCACAGLEAEKAVS